MIGQLFTYIHDPITKDWGELLRPIRNNAYFCNKVGGGGSLEWALSNGHILVLVYWLSSKSCEIAHAPHSYEREINHTKRWGEK